MPSLSLLPAIGRSTRRAHRSAVFDLPAPSVALAIPCAYVSHMPKRFQSSKGPSQRQLRAGELVRHTLVDILQRDEIIAEELPGQSVTVTEVRCSPDLRQATVFCTVLGGQNVPEAVDLLNRHAPKLRGLLGRKIEMKFTPELSFKADRSFDEADRIDALLARADVRRDLESDER